MIHFNATKVTSALHAMLCLMLCVAFIAPSSMAASEMPSSDLKVPILVPEESVSTYIPSASTGLKGLAVNVIIPEKPRYPDGAPVVVIAPGGDQADGLNFTMHAAQQGFVEVRLAFPGGGKAKFSSGGIYDYRGAQSQIAFKDVILFAAGKTADDQGRHISDLVPMRVSSTNIGVVGWSNGGNIVMTTLANYADQLSPIVSWLAFYESPIGPLFYPPNLGGADDLLLNPHYAAGSAATGEVKVDWRNLQWDDQAMRNAGEHRKRGEPEIRGVLFFDENGNRRWDESAEYALTYCLDVGLDKQIYPPDATHAIELIGRFTRWMEVRDDDDKERFSSQKKPAKFLKKKPSKDKDATDGADGEKKKKKMKKISTWPDALAKLDESEAYFQERDGSLCFATIAAKYPDLMITIMATKIDHMQRQQDHPHIAMQYNAWLANKAHWVRLNPDPIYPAVVANMNVGNFVHNKPNSSIDSATIATFLESDSSTKDYVLMEATIAELADRRRAKNLKSPLENVLTPYYNSANPAPPVPTTPPTPGAK